MKKTLTLSLVSALFLIAFASCKKDYNCKCINSTIVNGQEVAKNNTMTTKRASSRDEAKSQCVYYETEDSYLQQKTVVQHNCGIE